VVVAGSFQSLGTTEVRRSARRSLRTFTSITRKPKMERQEDKTGRIIASSASWMLFTAAAAPHMTQQLQLD